MLVPERLARLAAALANPLGELDHLIDRLLAVEPHDVVEDHLLDLLVGLAGQARKCLDEHRHHDLGPPLADQRQRAVEVEQHVADLGPRLEQGRQLDATPARGKGAGTDWAAHDWPHPAVTVGLMPNPIFHFHKRCSSNQPIKPVIYYISKFNTSNSESD